MTLILPTDQTEELIAAVRKAQVETAHAEHIRTLAEQREQQAIRALMDHLVEITPSLRKTPLQMLARHVS